MRKAVAELVGVNPWQASLSGALGGHLPKGRDA